MEGEKEATVEKGRVMLYLGRTCGELILLTTVRGQNFMIQLFGNKAVHHVTLTPLMFLLLAS